MPIVKNYTLIMKVFTALISSLLLISCGGDKQSEALAEKLNYSYQYDGKKIRMEGYIYTYKLIFSKNEEIRMKLHSSSFATRGNLLTKNLYINYGDNANQVKIPLCENCKPSDVKFCDVKGNEFGVGSKITITGTVHYTNKTEGSDDYSYKITDVTFEKE